MANKTPSFESNMNALEEIVSKLENGDVPLEKALDEFKKGVELSQLLQKTLNEAENTLTHMETDDDKEINFDDKNNEGDHK